MYSLIMYIGDVFTIPSFRSRSYIQLEPFVDGHQQILIEIRFKVHSPDGIILYMGETDDKHGDFISLTVKDQYLEFRYF